MLAARCSTADRARFVGGGGVVGVAGRLPHLEGAVRRRERLVRLEGGPSLVDCMENVWQY